MPKAIDELKQSIEREIKQINKKTFKKFENFLNCCILIISAEEGHIFIIKDRNFFLQWIRLVLSFKISGRS